MNLCSVRTSDWSDSPLLMAMSRRCLVGPSGLMCKSRRVSRHYRILPVLLLISLMQCIHRTQYLLSMQTVYPMTTPLQEMLTRQAYRAAKTYFETRQSVLLQSTIIPLIQTKRDRPRPLVKLPEQDHPRVAPKPSRTMRRLRALLPRDLVEETGVAIALMPMEIQS